jgi:hypothetical protein
VPVWGLGTVIETGRSVYGLCAMSSRVALDLDRDLVERSPHRAELPAFYNRYAPIDPDRPDVDATLLFRPLFGTAFLLDDAVAGDRDATVVLASASSKTAYALAFLLSRADRRVVGLTSPRNRGFVEGLGVYDRVLPYGEAGALAGDAEPLVLVDMAGDGAVRAAVHATGAVRRSLVVGATHWRTAAPAGDDLPGPAPELFFAPAHLDRLTADVGADELRRRMRAAWDAFAAWVGGWLEVEHGSGPEDVQRAWRALTDGDADPRRGHVLSLA